MSQAALVNFLAVTNGVNADFRADYLINNAIIADPEFSITLEAAPERFAVTEGIGKKPHFNGLSNPFLEISIDGGKIAPRDVRVINELIGHFSGKASPAPNLAVGQGLLGIESPSPRVRFLLPIEVLL